MSTFLTIAGIVLVLFVLCVVLMGLTWGAYLSAVISAVEGTLEPTQSEEKKQSIKDKASGN